MQATLLVCILTPIVGACVLPLIGRRAPRVRNLFALLFVFAAFVCAAALLPQFAGGSGPEAATIAITRQELADLTGISVETAIRSTKNMERGGLLDLSRPGRIKICDQAGLQKLLEE